MLIVVLIVAIQAAAAPATPGVFSFDRLRLGAAGGPENYLYTAGNVVTPEGGADAGAYYRFVVTDAAGAIRNAGFPCTPAGNFETTNNTYVVAPADPVSNSIAWKYTLQQFGTAACTGTPTKTAFKSFYVAKATTFADAALTTPAATFPGGSTAYVSVAGMKPGLKAWTTTWITPSAGVACANTTGNDRANSDGFGRFPSTVGGFHQYRPSPVSGGVALWNREANYETRPCPSFAPANDGAWRLRLEIDPTNFVELSVFSVDATPPPPPSIDSAPTSPSSSTSASFAFSSSEAGVSFLCQLDGGGFSACTSPKGYTSLGEGAHNFQVKARDAAGNESTPNTHNWTIDTGGPPPPSIDAAPASQSGSTSASFSFSSSEGGVSFFCQLDGAGFGACTSPKGYTSLGEGAHSFQVKARDGAGNESTPSTHNWTIDTSPPPSPSIDAAPPSPSSSASASFSFSSSEGGVSFLCRLDGAGFSACTSPKGYSSLGEGGHSFQVKARDGAGNESAPTTHNWTIDLPPAVTLTAPANGSSTNDTTPTFTGVASTGPADSNSVTVNVYAGSSPTGTPVQTLVAFHDIGGAYSVETATPLSEGTYTARAEQTDLGGNTGLSTANTFLIALGGYRLEVLGDSPRGYWRLGEAGGTSAADETGANPGSYVGGVSLGQPGALATEPNTSASFDGVDDYMTVPDSSSLRLTTGATIEAFVKRSKSGAWQVIASKPGNGQSKLENYALWFNTLDKAVGFFGDGTSFVRVDSPTVIDTNWHHFAVTYDNVTAKMYIDGVLRASTASTIRLTANTLPLNVGRTSGNTNFLGGRVDELAVYGTALSAARIQAHYNAASAFDTTPPAITLTNPANGSRTSNTTPTFSGIAGTTPGDSTSVTVKIYPGSTATGTPAQTRTTTRDGAGAYAVDASPALAEGIYTAQSEQSDLAHNLGRSSPTTFEVTSGDITPPAITLTEPANGSSSSATPTFNGVAGVEADDSTTVTINVYLGSSATGTPVQILTTTREGSGNYSSTAATLAAGTYTAQAEQSDIAGNTGRSPTTTFTVGSGYRAAVMADNPRGYWRLGEAVGATTAVDQTGANPGTYAGGVTLGQASNVSSDSDTAVSFDGTSGRVTVPDSNSLDLTTGVTVESWIKRTKSGVWQVVVSKPGNGASKNENYSIWINTLNKAVAFFGDGTSFVRVDSPTALDTAWHFVAASYDNATARLYVDGTLVASVPSTIRLTANGLPLNIGRTNDNLSFFGGMLDEVAIFPTALSGARIAAHFAASRQGDPTPPVVTLSTPEPGSATKDTTPAFAGLAGITSFDSTTVTVKLYSGSSATGTPIQTRATTRWPRGSWDVSASAPSLADGTYTVQAEQSDSAGNVGFSAPSTFVVASNPGASGDPVVLGAGDIADCTGAGDEATSDLFPLFPSATVLTFGDNAYDNGTVSQFNNCYDPSWGRAKTRTRPTIGGHDYQTPNGAGYFGYFQNQLAPFGPSASDPLRAYYSYDLGAWHVVHTNTECVDVSGCDVNAQIAWLRADLQAHPTSCTVVITHNPRWSSGSVHGDNTNIQAYWQAMYDNDVDLVLTGDDHDYERFAPQNPSGNWDPTRGIRQLVVGTGGFSHYLFSDGGIIKANSELRNDDTFGLIKVTLHSTSYEWEFLPQAGKSFTDSGSDTCH